jgi:hypothetical protein
VAGRKRVWSSLRTPDREFSSRRQTSDSIAPATKRMPISLVRFVTRQESKTSNWQRRKLPVLRRTQPPSSRSISIPTAKAISGADSQQHGSIKRRPALALSQNMQKTMHLK